MALLSTSGPQSIIAIAAGKGGVGKSTITINLALALALQGAQVGILDADVYGPSVRRMLPEQTLPAQKGPTLMPAMCSGIRVISLAFFGKENHATAVRAPIANQLIHQFITQVEWGPLDYLLIDFPPGTGDIQMSLCQKANLSGAIMVTTPQEVALMDVRKAMHLFEQVQVPILGIVENMSYYVQPSGAKAYPFGKDGGRRLAEEFAVPLLEQVPLDPLVSECGDLGRSIFDYPSVASAAFEELGHRFKALPKLPTVNVPQIHQQDAYSITVSWPDGRTGQYRLAQLQRQCPCAGCCDENAGRRMVDPVTIPNDLQAISFKQLGRYALQIQFASGCSKGIYTYEWLRNLGESN